MAASPGTRHADPRHCRIGSRSGDDGDRMPIVELELRRSGGHADLSNPLWKRADLTITGAGLTVSLECLAAEDLAALAEFLVDYEMRLRGS